MSRLKDVLVRGGSSAVIAGAAILGAGGVEKPVLAAGAKNAKDGLVCILSHYDGRGDCKGDASWRVVYKVAEDESTAQCYAHEFPDGEKYSMTVACAKPKPASRRSSR